MTLTAFLFYVLAILTGVCAVAMVVTQNIVRAAAWLLFALAGTAGIFFLLGADFVGATQLLVYVGGTLVLVVFGVMLTAQGPFITMKTGAAEWAIAAGVGLLLYGVLAVALVRPEPYPAPPRLEANQASAEAQKEMEARERSNATVLGGALLGLKEATPIADLTGVPPEVLRYRARVSYLLPFEIVSVHLLVVLIGAAYLARAKRRRGATP
jgi:NADH:ubiquinone oxidoreductase subunit 6 (subunit J)